MKNNYLRKVSKIPKSIKLFFLILHLTFGLDFGFGNLFGKKTAQFLKYYSTVLALVTFVILIYPFELVGDQVWYWCTVLQCLVNFCIQKTARYTVYNLLFDIHAAERINVLEKESFGVITSMYALMMFVLKGFAFAVICMFEHHLYYERLNLVYLIFYAACTFATDLIPDTQIVSRFYIYAYVKNMEMSLKQDQDINKLIERYDKIVDYQDNIRHLCDNVVSINDLITFKTMDKIQHRTLIYLFLLQTLTELLIKIPKLMSTSWSMLRYIKKGVRYVI